MSELLEKISNAIIETEEDESLDLVNQAIDQGLEPAAILEEGIIPGLMTVGEKFNEGEFFLLELSEGARIANLCIEKVTPLLAAGETDGKKKAKVLMATVSGDLHDIGKNLVVLQLDINGYDVVDMGIDQESLDIVRKAQEIKADVIALSCLMLTSMDSQNEVIRVLNDMGIRDQFKVVIGGGPTNQEWADKIGADGWAPDAVAAVGMMDSLF